MFKFCWNARHVLIMEAETLYMLNHIRKTHFLAGFMASLLKKYHKVAAHFKLHSQITGFLFTGTHSMKATALIMQIFRLTVDIVN